MEYLTVKEVAELKGCSEQYIKRQAKNGILSAELTVNPATNKTRYMIPLTALPEQLQEKWYKKQRTAAGVLPESSEPEPEKPKVEPAKPQRTFEELTEQERQEITVWAEILREWQGLRSTYKGSMKEFDKLYIGKCQLEHPNIKVSESILYRKWAAYRSNDMEGLLDGRGGWNRGASQIPAPIWDAFLYWWLDERKPTVSLCYRNVISWTEEFHPELVHLIPQERAFRRRIDRDVADYIQIMMRDGQKAFDDRCAPYIMRLYDQLEANDCWVADTHTLDIQSTKDGTKHRLYLTAFLDIKSGVLTGWNISDSASMDSVRLALRHGILRFGIPKVIYVDNGREYVNHQLGGKGHRRRKTDDPANDPPTIFKRLGIEMRNAIVRNADAKPIERTFRTVKEQFSKLFDGFCGGTILEKPENLKRKIKNGQLPCDYEVREVLADWIDGEFNCQPYGGRENCFKGMSRIDVWNSNISSIRKATESDLNLLLLCTTRKQKIKRNGVKILIGGQDIWFYNMKETLEHLGEEIYVRYDPADFRAARIYDAATDRYLFTWQVNDILLADYLEKAQDAIADPMERVNTARRFAKDEAKGKTDKLDREQRITMLDMTARRAAAKRADGFRIEHPKNIIPVMATEEQQAPLQKAVGAENTESITIDLKQMRQSAIERKKGNT